MGWIKGGRTTVDSVGGVFVYSIGVDYGIGDCDVGDDIFGAGVAEECC